METQSDNQEFRCGTCAKKITSVASCGCLFWRQSLPKVSGLWSRGERRCLFTPSATGRVLPGRQPGGISAIEIGARIGAAGIGASLTRGRHQFPVHLFPGGTSEFSTTSPLSSRPRLDVY